MNDPFTLAEPTVPVRSAPPRYLDGLNPDQREAVEATDGPLLVLAGAGTGKTRVLTTRLGHLLLSGRAQPRHILAVTFTNKAAREMKERVESLVGQAVEGWWIGTFHALGARMLRAHAEPVGLKSNFTILDEDDQLRLLKQLVQARGIDDKRWPARNLMAIIQRWKDRGLTPDRVSPDEGAEHADGLALTLYGDYQERLKAVNAVDFGDLLLSCLNLFAIAPDVLERYQRQFHYILVDEYQDTNVAQYLWLRLLAQGHRNLCCVGDDDQSIYSWRGAEIGNILKFEHDFPGARIVRLERNYRSTGHILGAASGVIAHNQGRLGKTLWTDDAAGAKVIVRTAWDGADEARQVGETIDSLRRQGIDLGEIAVLVRAGFQTREFEERLMVTGIPYRVVGGPRFYERLEIRDAIAYLRLIAQPEDDLAFERIVNTPKRGVGKAALATLHGAARAGRCSLHDAMRKLVDTDELAGKAKAALKTLSLDLDRWRGLVKAIEPSELTGQVLKESGYIEMWRRDNSPEAEGRVENLRELVRALDEFDTLGGFLDHVSLVMDNEINDGQPKVSLMTLHGAKGLEFDTVFLPGWEEGLFPHQRALDEGGNQALEEERRLAYVGLTRARRRAVVLHAASRRVFNEYRSNLPSRFIGELPEGHIERYAAPGFGEGRAASGFADRRPNWTRETPEPAAGLAVGERIFHLKFGYGRIVAMDGDKLDIAFDKAGDKKVMAGFVEKA